MTLQSYRDLVAWQKSMTLVGDFYALTRQLPDGERYGLISQMRRSAISIPSNIAEGQGRETTADFLRFLYIARASTHELSTQAELCIQLAYGNDFERVVQGCDEIGRILNGLMPSDPRPTNVPWPLTTDH